MYLIHCKRKNSKSFCCAALLASALSPISLTAQTPTELLAKADGLADRGNWYAAAPIYASAETAFHQTGDTRNEMYAMFGRLHREVEQGSYSAVRTRVARALEKPVIKADPQLQIRGLALLGTIDLNINTAAAREDWNQVLDIAKKAGDLKWENRARGELGLVAGVDGDTARAGLALYSAIATATRLGDVAAHINFATWLANGMSIHDMGDHAIPIIDSATKFALQNGYTKVPLELSIAKIRAVSRPSNSPNIAEANKLLASTLAQAKNEHVLGAETELLNLLGEFALRRGDLPAAEKAFSQATEIAAGADLPREEAEAWMHLSQFYRAAKQPDKAATAIDHGIQTVQRVEEAYDLPEFVAEKAEVQAALGDKAASDASYRRATDLIEGLLVNAPTSQVKSAMVGAMSQIYLAHFRLAWDELHNGPYAFSIIESARGRTLLDSIRYSRQSGPGSTAQTRAEAEIARLQRSLMHDRLTNAQTRHTLDLLDAAYVQMNPIEYARQRKEMGMARRRPVTVAALQARLRPRESLIEYVLDEKGSYAINISHEAGLKIYRLPPRSHIGELSKSFVTAIRKNGDSQTSAQELYKAIIKPVIAPNTASFIVVPDGPLHLVPFSALMDEKGAYLNSQVTLSAAPSATIYATLDKTERSAVARKPFLGVAFSPPTSAASTSAPATRGLTDLRSGRNLTPLRFGREEVIEAAKVFGPESVILDGAQASEQALKAQPLGEFKVIHLAAHGISDEKEPDRAALILAPGSESEDGLWQAREIRRTRLNADVVVLSACETGSGKLQGQEGIMNLARAFLAAGAKSVVASLWAVEDRSTATVMESFYEHLKDGSTVNEALQKAQLDFIKGYGEKAKPELWAGFEVIGDGTRRIDIENKTDTHATRSGF